MHTGRTIAMACALAVLTMPGSAHAKGGKGKGYSGPKYQNKGTQQVMVKSVRRDLQTRGVSVPVRHEQHAVAMEESPGLVHGRGRTTFDAVFSSQLAPR